MALFVCDFSLTITKTWSLAHNKTTTKKSFTHMMLPDYICFDAKITNLPTMQLSNIKSRVQVYYVIDQYSHGEDMNVHFIAFLYSSII
jgi:hypothetical protein